MERKDALQELRRHVPVGLQQAQLLLEECAGNVAAAKQLFITRLAEIVSARTGITSEEAVVYLEGNDYHIGKVMDAIAEVRYTLTERILQRSKDKERAIDKIADALEQQLGLKRQFWLQIEELQLLHPIHCCFLAVHEWMAYEDWEGITSAIYYHPVFMAAQLEKLEMSLLGELLLQATSDSNSLDALAATYPQGRSVLIDRLYALIENNIPLFP